MIWPDCCVRCGVAAPGSAFRFRAARVAWYQILTLSWAWGSRPLVEAPACPGCARSLRRSRVLRLLTSWAVLFPVGFAVLILLRRTGWAQGPLGRPIVGLGIVAAFLPYVLVEIFHPPVIDATARGRTVEFEFRDRLFAAVFAAANGGQVC